ncbi:MAG: thioesterase family protein [Bacteroidales bacterium]|jgi:predicted thioesterase
MEFNIPLGIIGKQEMMVAEKDTAAHYGSGLIEVFATPAMVGFMEGTAQLSVQPCLPGGYITLGIEINVKHLKATPVGMKVFCESKLINVDGKKLTFEIKAWDEKGDIGTALHHRYIVEAAKFMEKLHAK